MKKHIDWISFYKFEIFVFLAILNGILAVTGETFLVLINFGGVCAALYLARKCLREC